VGLLIVLLALASVGMVIYVVFAHGRDAAAAAEKRPQPTLERDLSEVGQAIPATTASVPASTVQPAEKGSDWFGGAEENWRKMLVSGIHDLSMRTAARWSRSTHKTLLTISRGFWYHSNTVTPPTIPANACCYAGGAGRITTRSMFAAIVPYAKS
jgi:hypothetical protein